MLDLDKEEVGMDAYVIWFIVAIAFTVLEMFTSGFAVMCFGIGALFASIVSCFAGLNAQIAAMVIGTALSFFLVRPIVLKFFSKKEKEFKSNADALIGRAAIVSEKIDAAAHTGRVAVDGDDWRAVSEAGDVIEKGTRVEIVNRNSLILTVKK
ncbi:MAG: NfeD family protein [Paludibacteraceae bacterium]|nr:NfeD family protein [Paludibacteraceae bacterium]